MADELTDPIVCSKLKPRPIPEAEGEWDELVSWLRAWRPPPSAVAVAPALLLTSGERLKAHLLERAAEKPRSQVRQSLLNKMRFLRRTFG